jgi:hypothetical protein
MDFRFRGRNGHAADMTGMTEFGPQRTSRWPADRHTTRVSGKVFEERAGVRVE